jgi:hypothetical protein
LYIRLQAGWSQGDLQEQPQGRGREDQEDLELLCNPDEQKLYRKSKPDFSYTVKKIKIFIFP